MPTTVLISDLHLGATSRARRPAAPADPRAPARGDRARRCRAARPARRHARAPRRAARPSAARRARVLRARSARRSRRREVVLVPGNHDHRLLGPWLERTGEGDAPARARRARRAEPHSVREAIADWLGEPRLEVRYPGIWVRDGRVRDPRPLPRQPHHAADDRAALGRRRSTGSAACRPAGARPPHDYEKVHAPVYDLIFNLAQGGRNLGATRRDRALSGAADLGDDRRRLRQGPDDPRQAARLRGRPGDASGLERAGIGRFDRDFSIAEIGRAGVEAHARRWSTGSGSRPST